MKSDAKRFWDGEVRTEKQSRLLLETKSPINPKGWFYKEGRENYLISEIRMKKKI